MLIFNQRLWSYIQSANRTLDNLKDAWLGLSIYFGNISQQKDLFYVGVHVAGKLYGVVLDWIFPFIFWNEEWQQH